MVLRFLELLSELYWPYTLVRKAFFGLWRIHIRVSIGCIYNNVNYNFVKYYAGFDLEVFSNHVPENLNRNTMCMYKFCFRKR